MAYRGGGGRGRGRREQHPPYVWPPPGAGTPHPAAPAMAYRGGGGGGRGRGGGEQQHPAYGGPEAPMRGRRGGRAPPPATVTIRAPSPTPATVPAPSPAAATFEPARFSAPPPAAPTPRPARARGRWAPLGFLWPAATGLDQQPGAIRAPSPTPATVRAHSPAASPFQPASVSARPPAARTPTASTASIAKELEQQLFVTETALAAAVEASQLAAEKAPEVGLAPDFAKMLRQPARPGARTAGKKVMIRANHFLVNVADNNLFHYDVSINPESKSRQTNREVLAELIKVHGKTSLGGKLPAYDGRKSLYTAGSLPFESEEFSITLVDPEKKDKERAEREYKITIRIAGRTDLYHLQQFLCGRQRDMPQETIQVLDVVLKESPSWNYVTVSRSFFSTTFGHRGDIGEGLECWRGYYQSLRPTQMGLSLNIDISATSFFKPVTVIQFVQEFLNLRDISRPLNDRDRVKIKKALRGVRVETNHQTDQIRRYKITGLTAIPMSQLIFPVDERGTRMSVVEYFKKRYDYILQHTNWPCLQSGSDARPVYLPMEACKIVEGQRYSKKLNDKQVTNILRATCQRPQQREQSIREMVLHNKYPEDRFAQEFGIKVCNDLVSVPARVLLPPMLRHHDSGRQKTCAPSVRQWNIKKKMINGGTIYNWACLNFSRMRPRHASRPNKQYMENVALKINVKAGGRNKVLENPIMRNVIPFKPPPPGEDSASSTPDANSNPGTSGHPAVSRIVNALVQVLHYGTLCLPIEAQATIQQITSIAFLKMGFSFEADTYLNSNRVPVHKRLCDLIGEGDTNCSVFLNGYLLGGVGEVKLLNHIISIGARLFDVVTLPSVILAPDMAPYLVSLSKESINIVLLLIALIYYYHQKSSCVAHFTTANVVYDAQQNKLFLKNIKEVNFSDTSYFMNLADLAAVILEIFNFDENLLFGNSPSIHVHGKKSPSWRFPLLLAYLVHDLKVVLPSLPVNIIESNAHLETHISALAPYTRFAYVTSHDLDTDYRGGENFLENLVGLGAAAAATAAATLALQQASITPQAQATGFVPQPKTPAYIPIPSFKRQARDSPSFKSMFDAVDGKGRKTCRYYNFKRVGHKWSCNRNWLFHAKHHLNNVKLSSKQAEAYLQLLFTGLAYNVRLRTRFPAAPVAWDVGPCPPAPYRGRVNTSGLTQPWLKNEFTDEDILNLGTKNG